MLALHAQGQVTTERLTALLNGIGVEISKRQVVRLLTGSLDDLVAEDQEVLRAGLATARWITVDDTAARHARKDGFTTQIGDASEIACDLRGFAVFRTGASKSREAFLSLLRAGHTDHVVNAAALDFMRMHGLSGQVVAQLDAHPAKLFADAAAWAAHLARLGVDTLAVTPDPVQVATEAALWGAICHHGLLPGAVVVSDGAGQFRAGIHALCWVHAERLVHKLVPATPEQRRAVEVTRSLIWWFYADLKAWAGNSCPRRAAALRARFDRIFRRQTGYTTLDRLLARLHRRKAELLRILERPEIPLHTNGSENDSACGGATAGSARTCSPSSTIPRCRPTTTVPSASCVRLPPTARSPAGFAPIGALTCSPACAPLSAPPHAAAWMPTKPSSKPYAGRPSPTRVEQIRLLVSIQLLLKFAHKLALSPCELSSSTPQANTGPVKTPLTLPPLPATSRFRRHASASKPRHVLSSPLSPGGFRPHGPATVSAQTFTAAAGRWSFTRRVPCRIEGLRRRRGHRRRGPQLLQRPLGNARFTTTSGIAG